MLGWLQTAEGISFIFDFVMLLCILGGFILWRKESERAREIEEKLASATAQLDKASQLMAASMEHVQRAVKLAAQEKDGISTEKVEKPSVSKPSAYSKVYAQQAQPAQGTVKERSVKSKKTRRLDGGNQLAQVLQMHRQGQTESEISMQLGIPLEEVDLMIKVHMAKSSS